VERPFPPAEAVWHALRRLADAHEEAGKAHGRWQALAVGLARESFAYARVLATVRERLLAAGLGREYRSLEIMARRLEALLASQEVRYEDLAGRTVDDDLLELADVQSWVAGEVEKETVLETTVPPVFWRQELLERGRIIAVTRA
jgi:hypothetical protein